jgi:hypothetical protein
MKLTSLLMNRRVSTSLAMVEDMVAGQICIELDGIDTRIIQSSINRKLEKSK